MKFWVSGRLLAADEARVGVLDHGFTVGDGVFETLMTVDDPGVGVVPFAMDRHIGRLASSAAGMGLPAPDPDVVRDALLGVCAANPELAGGGRLRVTYTSGAGPLGSGRAEQAPTLAVAASPASGWPESTTLALSPWPRNERSPLVGLKTTSYAENVLALAHAKAAGAGEALLLNLAGELCEGTGSNVFGVRDGVVVTPPLASGCLAGITRGLVLEWCRADGLPAEEQVIQLAELADLDEMFVTSSTRGVHPVDAVLDDAGNRLWEGQIGPVTKNVAQIYADGATADWNP